MLALTSWDGRSLTLDHQDVSSIEQLCGQYTEARVVMKNGKEYEVRETPEKIRAAILRAYEIESEAQETASPSFPGPR